MAVPPTAAAPDRHPRQWRSFIEFQRQVLHGHGADAYRWPETTITTI